MAARSSGWQESPSLITSCTYAKAMGIQAGWYCPRTACSGTALDTSALHCVVWTHPGLPATRLSICTPGRRALAWPQGCGGQKHVKKARTWSRCERAQSPPTMWASQLELSYCQDFCFHDFCFHWLSSPFHWNCAPYSDQTVIPRDAEGKSSPHISPHPPAQRWGCHLFLEWS